ncbi:hypothetical protein [Burkholderia sp. PR2]|uniref:hypothetical protein n=1 Tax=Burkholderia sp. PR2 TaxID=3448078 RepID=UPI00402AF7E8
MHPLYELLNRLEDRKIYYSLSRHRSDTVLVSITLPGLRIEVDVFADGNMDVCRFSGTEEVEGFSDLIYEIISKADI